MYDNNPTLMMMGMSPKTQLVLNIFHPTKYRLIPEELFVSYLEQLIAELIPDRHVIRMMMPSQAVELHATAFHCVWLWWGGWPSQQLFVGQRSMSRDEEQGMRSKIPGWFNGQINSGLNMDFPGQFRVSPISDSTLRCWATTATSLCILSIQQFQFLISN